MYNPPFQFLVMIEWMRKNDNKKAFHVYGERLDRNFVEYGNKGKIRSRKKHQDEILHFPTRPYPLSSSHRHPVMRTLSTVRGCRLGAGRAAQERMPDFVLQLEEARAEWRRRSKARGLSSASDPA